MNPGGITSCLFVHNRTVRECFELIHNRTYHMHPSAYVMHRNNVNSNETQIFQPSRFLQVFIFIAES